MDKNSLCDRENKDMLPCTAFEKSPGNPAAAAWRPSGNTTTAV